MNKFFAFILGLMAIALASTTAFFSVYGISKLFIGKALAVIILFGLLEATKIILISVYHQYYKKLSRVYKIILISFTIILMSVTSIGVYGFLTSAYSNTSVNLQKVKGQTRLFEKKIELKKEEKNILVKEVSLKNKRAISLSELRKNQEARLDSLYQKGWYRSAKGTEKIIKEANNDVNSISDEVDGINIKIQAINDSINFYEIKKLELNSGKLSGEIGPLKYIATITGLPMDHVVNWLMLIFMFLADPGAVLLVVLTNKVIKINKEEKEKKRELLLNKEKDNSVVYEKAHLEENKEPLEESNDKADFLKKESSVITTAKEQEIVPKKKEKEAAEYVANQDGEFIKVKKEIVNIEKPLILPGVFTAETPSEEVKTIKEEDRSEYITLLTYFYKNGNAKKGEEIPVYAEFKNTLENDNIKVNEKTLQDFLLICGLLKITEFKDKKGTYNKEFEEAKKIISKI